MHASLLQSVAVAMALYWPRFRVFCSVLQCVAVCCSVLQCVAVGCSVLLCVAVCCSGHDSVIQSGPKVP